MKKDQNGFGVIELLLVLVLVAVVGFGGYYVWNTQQDKSTKTTTKQASKEQSTGGPAPSNIVSTNIKLVTGQYIPAHVEVKKGSTVTWEISDANEMKYAVENDTNSSEKFSSGDLKTNDKFSHKFDTVGVFSWHDKYSGNLTGSVTVTE
jgi:prepilin-type N-terminal cleavage/methylation domain-containing protein